MNDTKLGYDAHLFICTNSPEKPGKCGSKGSEDMRCNLKEKCHTEFGKRARINSSGCLGHCERGIAAVLYSEKNSGGQWFLDLSKEDGQTLYNAVKASLVSS